MIAPRAGHAQIESSANRRHARTHGAPVADNRAVKTPLATQDLAQQPFVLGAVDAVQLVVRRHHTPRAGVAHHMLKRREYSSRSVRSSTTESDTIRACSGVGGKVLEARANPAALDASHHRRAELTRNNRVLAEILEVADRTVDGA